MLKRSLKTALILLLLVSIAWILYNAVVNQHIHDRDGRFSHHSHPYDRDNPEHCHSDAEFLFYEFISFIAWLIFISILLFEINKLVIQRIRPSNDSVLYSHPYLRYIPRGPPDLSSLHIH